MYKNILFDLDGTIIHSEEGIVKSVQYALAKFGIKENDMDKLRKFIGPPLFVSFDKYYNFQGDDLQKAIDSFREYFREKGIFENQLYKGIIDLIKSLNEKNKVLFIATTKIQEFADKIIKHHHLEKYFSVVAGSSVDTSCNTKNLVIKKALNSKDNINLSETIMIGDHEDDVLGAKENNIHSIGVKYGFGDNVDLEKAQPTFLVDTVEDLHKILL